MSMVRAVNQPQDISPKDKYQCPKCQCVLRDAVQTSCGHWLCQGCAEEMFANTAYPQFCPRSGCEQPITDKPVPDKAIRKEIETTPICCCVCQWSGNMGSLSQFTCPTCGQAWVIKILINEIESVKYCPFKELGCTCNTPMNEGQLQRHLNENIPAHIGLMFKSMEQLGLDQNQIVRMIYIAVSTYYKDNNTTRAISSESSHLDYQMQPVMVANEGSSQYVVSSFMPLYQHMQDFLVYVKPEEIFSVIREKDMLISSYQRIFQAICSNNMSHLYEKNKKGCYFWKIPDFSCHFQNAKSGLVTSLMSPPFYSNLYKMCLRLYLNGDGPTRGTHVSLFFVIMKGEFDDILQWPFTLPVTLKLLNQSGGQNISRLCNPDPGSSSFQKPISDMNVAYGCPDFVVLSSLFDSFITNDTISFFTEVGNDDLGG